MQRLSGVVILVVGAVILGAVLIGIGLLLAVAAFWRFSAHGGMMAGGCPWCGGPGAFGGGSIAALFALLFIVVTGLALLGLFILGALWLARGGRQR